MPYGYISPGKLLTWIYSSVKYDWPIPWISLHNYNRMIEIFERVEEDIGQSIIIVRNETTPMSNAETTCFLSAAITCSLLSVLRRFVSHQKAGMKKSMKYHITAVTRIERAMPIHRPTRILFLTYLRLSFH